MKDGYIAVLDSGIGGLSVLKKLVKEFPCERFLYFGDNKHTPYGNKSERELKQITAKNLDYLKRYNIKVIVVACNTLSVNILPFIEDYSGVKTFGIFPPVEKCVLRGEKVLLLATAKTVSKFQPTEKFHTVGFINLVRDIENNLFDLQKVSVSDNLNQIVGNFVAKKGYYDTVILGCTHFEFVKNKIFDHFCPQTCDSGINFTIKNLKSFFEKQKILVNHLCFDLVFVGENAKVNRNFWVAGGQNISKY